MTHVPADDLVEGLVERLNPYMRRILGGTEDPHVVGELMFTLTEPPYFEHLRGVGWLYRIWGDLSDIVDGCPTEYGPDSDTLASREFTQAAQDWLDMPPTLAGLEDYIEQRKARFASLSTPEPRRE